MFPKLASPALGFAVSNLKKTELETETETETQLGEQVYCQGETQGCGDVTTGHHRSEHWQPLYIIVVVVKYDDA